MFVLLTTKRFVPNVLFLDSIKDMNLKVFNKFKNKKMNATFQYFQFLNKNNKLKSVCVINKPNQGLLKFLIKKEIYLKNKLDKSIES